MGGWILRRGLRVIDVGGKWEVSAMRWKYLPSMYEKGKLRDFWVGKYIREFRRAYAQKNWPMTWTSLDRLDSETKNAVKCGVMT